MTLGAATRCDQSGVNTAEYAVGTVAACGFACLLFQLLPAWRALLLNALLRILEIRLGPGAFRFPL